MLVMPALTPDSTPIVLPMVATVAIPGAALFQTPPAIPVRWKLVPTHVDVSPVIPGLGRTTIVICDDTVNGNAHNVLLVMFRVITSPLVGK